MNVKVQKISQKIVKEHNIYTMNVIMNVSLLHAKPYQKLMGILEWMVVKQINLVLQKSNTKTKIQGYKNGKK